MSARWWGGLALLVLGAPLAAQDVSLPTGLDPATIDALEAEIARAEAAGLPGRPLVLKALEGRSKGASDQQILGAVVALRERLEIAAGAIGSEQGEDVLVAAAGALYVGADRETLRRMTEKTRSEALGMALVVLGDLLRRGVPVETAGDAIVSMGAAGVDASILSEFRRSVDEDIRTGLAPARATEVRLQGVLARIGGPPGAG